MKQMIKTKIGLWYSKPVENLGKKELLEVIKYLSRIKVGKKLNDYRFRSLGFMV